MINITTVQSPNDLEQILHLQQSNLLKNLTRQEVDSEGFVTVEHDFKTLSAMNETHPHIIAKQNDKVVAYALVMLKEFADDVPILKHLFENIDTLSFNNENLKDCRYFVMGQICIDRAHRSQGVFKRLYHKMAHEMRPHFDYIITEISTNNPRSIRAHEKAGFQTLRRYAGTDSDWLIVIYSL